MHTALILCHLVSSHRSINIVQFHGENYKEFLPCSIWHSCKMQSAWRKSGEWRESGWSRGLPESQEWDNPWWTINIHELLEPRPSAVSYLWTFCHLLPCYDLGWQIRISARLAILNSKWYNEEVLHAYGLFLHIRYM